MQRWTRAVGVAAVACALLLGCGGGAGSAGDGGGGPAGDAGGNAPDAAPDATPDALPVTVPDAAPDTAPDTADPTDHELLTYTLPDGREDTATGVWETPAHEYPPYPLDPAYRHVLSFQLTPWAFPLRAGVPSNGPVIAFTDALDVIVFSPLDHFFTSFVTVEDGAIRHGVAGDVRRLPPGFTHRFLVVRGKGINATVERWGALLRADRGIEARDRYADAGLSYLGYWTDNGAAYFYATEPDMTYEETLLAVKADADARGIPYGHFQIDSWWYYRGPDTATRKGGLVRWEPRPDVFPDGLAAFRQRLGLPLVAHTKWFVHDNDYRDEYEFVDGPNWSLPLDGAIYDRFLRDAAAWGIETYEPDWLMSYLWEVPWLREEVGRAERWMSDQGDAALAHGRTMQLCMAGAAHLMYTVEMPAVTTFRTSIDYHAEVSKESFWPMFHTVNLLAGAVGVWPFKDNFHSAERYGEQEALVANLSGGMVGVGDALGAARPEVLRRTCRADGLLLKPDRPATPLDTMFLPHRRPFWTATWSDRPGQGRWVYLAGYHLARDHAARAAFDEAFAFLTYDGRDLGEMFVWPDAVDDWTVDLERDLGWRGPAVVWDWRRREARHVAASEGGGTFSVPPAPDLYDYAYLVVVPVLGNGLALIGEPDRYVTLADRRFRAVAEEPDAVRVTLEGQPGEQVTVLAYDTRSGALLEPVTAAIGPDGAAEARLARP